MIVWTRDRIVVATAGRIPATAWRIGSTIDKIDATALAMVPIVVRIIDRISAVTAAIGPKSVSRTDPNDWMIDSSAARFNPEKGNAAVF